jgi:chromosome partitioning protein
MDVFATYSIKGGVGKTAAAVNLAYLAAEQGLPTLLCDLDPQGSASFLLRVKPKVRGGGKGLVRRKRPVLDAIKATDFTNLDLLPADFSFRHLDLALDALKHPTRRLAQIIEPLAEEYELVIFDCAPGISLVSEAVFGAARTLLVPIVPSTLSVRTLDQLNAFLADQPSPKPDVVAFFSLVDQRRRLHREVVESLPVDHTVLEAVIPAASEVERMGVERAPVAAFAPSSRGARGYAALWAELQPRLRRPIS